MLSSTTGEPTAEKQKPAQVLFEQFDPCAISLELDILRCRLGAQARRRTNILLQWKGASAAARLGGCRPGLALLLRPHDLWGDWSFRRYAGLSRPKPGKIWVKMSGVSVTNSSRQYEKIASSLPEHVDDFCSAHIKSATSLRSSVGCLRRSVGRSYAQFAALDRDYSAIFKGWANYKEPACAWYCRRTPA